MIDWADTKEGRALTPAQLTSFVDGVKLGEKQERERIRAAIAAQHSFLTPDLRRVYAILAEADAEYARLAAEVKRG